MFRLPVTDLQTQPTTTQQRLMFAQCACKPILIPLAARVEITFVLKDELRTSQVCVATAVRSTSVWNMHLARARRPLLGVRCSVQQTRRNAHRIYHERFSHGVSRLSHYCS
jgi:hypothetical protein